MKYCNKCGKSFAPTMVMCTASLERDDGEIINVFLVEKNADTNNGEILTSSPLGEALMGGLSGEEVEYTIGKNDMLKSVRIIDVTAST